MGPFPNYIEKQGGINQMLTLQHNNLVKEGGVKNYPKNTVNIVCEWPQIYQNTKLKIVY